MMLRAEGWDWPRVQAEACPQCGLNPSMLQAPALVRAVLVETSSWQCFLADMPDDQLRTSPRSGTWTPIQYAVHVRDMLTVYRARMLHALQETDPLLASFEPSQDVWMQYNQMPALAVGAELEQSARALIEVLYRHPGPAWCRPAHRDDGARFTVLGMARFALHETHHHLLDASGESLLGDTAASCPSEPGNVHTESC